MTNNKKTYTPTNALPKWEEGMLDIHFISTGRGSSAFYIMPDGTTMLVDAGDTSDEHSRTLSPRQTPRIPNGSKSAPQWIIDYIKQFGPNGKDSIIDYALITHWHDDHFGEMDSKRKLAQNKAYRLFGITEVGNAIPIKKLMDRGYLFPDKNSNIINLKKEIKNSSVAPDIISTMTEYFNFSKYHLANNRMKYEEFEIGSNSQISQKYKKEKYPDFVIRNLTANGKVWTGENKDTFTVSSDITKENNLSTSFRLQYGNFNFFTGGDIVGVDDFSMPDMNSMEAHVAPLVGPVDIATLNHHGNRNSQNPNYVRTIRPRVWIGETWSSDQPGEDTLRRITSKQLYPNDRDIFSTAMLESNKIVIGELIDNSYKSTSGHIVVRVFPGGDNYKIYVLDCNSESKPVTKEFDYKSR
jgi:beta-lactamase superfamily II metal-dependent hydrolase